MSTPYNGTLVGVTFENGRPAKGSKEPDDVEAFAASIAAYAKRHGMGIVDDTLVVFDPEERLHVDSRDVGVHLVGTKLRDASVDPKPTDHLVPTNAGHADPHGPDVVSPELHGVESAKTITPGDVGTPTEQQVDETGATVDATDVELEQPPTSGAGSGKDAWVTYAISKGADPDEVGLLTRDALIEAYGS